MAMLDVKNIHKAFGDLQVLKGVSLDLDQGETKVLIGPSGTGKSTLLRCINQLTPPDEGEVWLDGVEITDRSVDINKYRQDLGFVFQHFNLFNHLTALRNVSIGLEKVRGLEKEKAKERASEELKRVGLSDKAEQYPAELSGGQKQRVGIARALAMEPKVMLFDEPTSALDPELIGEVLEVMKGLAGEISMLVVTHEMGFASSVANEIIFLEDGVVVEKGTPEKFFENPDNERTKEFLSKIATLYGDSGD